MDGLDAALVEEIGLTRWAVLARLAHLMRLDGDIDGAWSIQMRADDLARAIAAGSSGWASRVSQAIPDLVAEGLLFQVDSKPLGEGRGREAAKLYAAWDPRFALPNPDGAIHGVSGSPTPPPPTPGSPLSSSSVSGMESSDLKSPGLNDAVIKPLVRRSISPVEAPVHEGASPDPAAITAENLALLMNVMDESIHHEKAENPDSGAAGAVPTILRELLDEIGWGGPPPAGAADRVLIAVIQDLKREKAAGRLRNPGGRLREMSRKGPEAIESYARNRQLLHRTLGDATPISSAVELMPVDDFVAARDADPAWYERVRALATARLPEGSAVTTAHVRAAALEVPSTHLARGRAAQ